VDNHLSFDQHVSDVVRSCNFHIRSLCHIRPLIDRETAVNLACSIVASRLDYCNSLLYGVSETNIAKLQQMQNNITRAVYKSPTYRANGTGCVACIQRRILTKLLLLHITCETASNLVTYWTRSSRISLLEH